MPTEGAWQAGDPCASCGSNNTAMESVTLGYPLAFCRDCGASDDDE